MRGVSWIAVFVCWALGAGAWAGELTHRRGGVTLWIPDHWTSKEANGGEFLYVMDPDEDVAFAFKIAPVSTIQEALKRLDTELGRSVQRLELGQAQESAINGLSAWGVDGTGVVDGKAVDLSVMLVKTPTDRVLLVVLVARSSRVAHHAEHIRHVLLSLRPASAFR